MDRFRVVGGARLAGEVRVPGAKNSVLKLMAAALLAEGTTTLNEVPDILDVEIMSELLRRLGCDVEHDAAGSRLVMQVPARPGHQADYDLVRRMRASIAVLGPLVARLGEADVALPGGDAIGTRGLDMHVAGLQKLGATVESEHGFIIAKAPEGLKGATIWLDFPSVGATENILMAAVLATGTTVIDNAAREPEIVDLCHLLSEMGAKIGGAGTSTIEIEGVDALRPADHVTVPDRIVAGTFAFAAAMTRGDIAVRNARPQHLEIALDKLSTAGASVSALDDGFRVIMERRPVAVDVVTLPFPGFATDLLPLVIGFNAVADGAAMITENVFESRFMFVQELVRLGADVRTDGHHAVVRGKGSLSGAPVQAHDIRAGAGLVLAGLVADGVTTVGDAYHVDRGYPRFAEQLQALGADVRREPDPDR
ncbi:MAG: UDP-N-acetylglucosamine 1-carboxyvinyltransferase [Actinomycetota bacterium]|nr:UDP-N-acetylglucosamine 1-carboxyvinyltransferase [Actinomycetota bacterium]